MAELLWTPSPDRVAATHLTRFTALAAARAGRTFHGYDDLYAWSIAEPAAFWAAMWDFAGLRSPTPIEAVLEHPTMPGARWFRGATLNYAEALLGHRDAETAIV